VWWRAATSVRWTAISTAISTGSSSTWVMYMRDSNCGSPGNGAPQISSPRLPPTTGSDSATEYPIASPMPDSRSSTSE
jgi:hypothetical protein